MSIIHGMPEAEYHAHPALSSTGARQLLVSPATFRYAQTHPQKPKAVFDLGTAAHAKALGVGAETVAIPEKLLAINGAASTKEAKQFIADARAEGKTPLKQEVVDTVDAMCEALLAHPEAAPFFEQEGQAEMSVFATDPDTGVELRCRFDFLPNFIEEDPWHFDLKTARSAEYEAFCKATAEHGYDVQQEHYLHTYALASGDPTARMKFIVVESEPPHLVNVHELALEFTEIGAARAKRARELFASCTESGVWPGYETNQRPLQPPLWYIYQNQGLLQ